MRRPELDQLIRLPEDQAVQRSFDRWNYTVLRWPMLALATASLFALIQLVANRSYFEGAAWGLTLLGLIVLFLFRRSRFVEQNYRTLITWYLVIQLLLMVIGSPVAELNIVLAGFLFPAILVFLRFRPSERLMLTISFYAVGLWMAFGVLAGESAGSLIAILLGMAIFSGFCLWAGAAITRRARQYFLDRFRKAASKERERARMRGELDDARRLQLAMLPSAAPRLEWLRLASVSIPATEVGGDYFDYFPLGPDRLAIVIGDVAGHGAASGMVLAGVRAGLYLLRDELHEPVAVLRKLDRTVRDSAPSRMFVTLLIAVLDRRSRSLRVASAGHPPLLHAAAGGSTPGTLGNPSLPLGSPLGSEPTESTTDLRPGDTLLLYTDGVIEATNFHGDQYGPDHLDQAFLRAATQEAASEVRDEILGSVSAFKGDVEQRDDLTVVVGRLSESF